MPFWKRDPDTPHPADATMAADATMPADAPMPKGAIDADAGDAAVETARMTDATTAPIATSATAQTIVTDTLPLVEEQLVVGKVAVPGDTIRVSTQTEEITDTVEIDLRQESYDVVRVSVDQVVDTIPEIRRENGVTIIPVMEERLVVTKQLVLREELHIREDHKVVAHSEPVVLRKQTAVVERESADE